MKRPSWLFIFRWSLNLWVLWLIYHGSWAAVAYAVMVTFVGFELLTPAVVRKP